MNKQRLYQVRNEWTVFRMPERDIRADVVYNDVKDWLDQNCSGPYKIFLIESGRSASYYNTAGTRTKLLNYKQYQPLVQVDIQYKKDAMLFKMAFQ